LSECSGHWFPDAEIDIVKTCVSYLSFDIFESGFCVSNEEHEARLQLNPLHDYSARHWGHHLRKAPDAQHQIPGFLSSESKASAFSQAMMVSENRWSEYSQKVLRQIREIHLPVWFGLTEMVGLLLEDRHDSDCTDSKGRTPPSWAAEKWHEMVVRLLLARDDVEVDWKDEDGQTPLWWAGRWHKGGSEAAAHKGRC
jgi:hypothetical protein